MYVCMVYKYVWICSAYKYIGQSDAALYDYVCTSYNGVYMCVCIVSTVFSYVRAYLCVCARSDSGSDNSNVTTTMQTMLEHAVVNSKSSDM